MPRNTSGLKRGGPGRPKGVPNKATTEIKAAAHALIHDELGWARLLTDYRRGKLAPAVMIALLHYAHGVPKHTTVVEGPDGALSPLVVYLPDNGRGRSDTE